MSSHRHMTRRAFVAQAMRCFCCPMAGCLAPALRAGQPNVSAIPRDDAGLLVNDLHSQLNATRVAQIVKPATVADLQAVIERAGAAGQAVAVAGGRHAMGGQQFATDALLIDLRGLNRVLAFDDEAGVVSVEGGIQSRLVPTSRPPSRAGPANGGFIRNKPVPTA